MRWMIDVKERRKKIILYTIAISAIVDRAGIRD